MNELDVLLDKQFGFRAEHSTEFQLLRGTQTISLSLPLKGVTVTVFLYIEVAFDTVWYDGLVLKMVRLGMNPNIIKVIRSYLNGRTFQIRADRAFYQTSNVAAGVPHSSISGSELFLLFVSDMPREPHSDLDVYADDPLFSSHPETRDSQSAGCRGPWTVPLTGSGGNTSESTLGRLWLTNLLGRRGRF